ncbi:MAG: cell division protein SepF, partial [Actinobacteria bacterium]|nr:cell division protein SepF [Actinomycetota bacterium]
MASAMRKMAVYLGLVEEGDEQYDDYDYAPADQYERAVVAQQPR